MKKKVAVLIVISLLFAGVVSAAGLYGKFEGYQIIRVQSNGKTLAVQDVPAVSLNGRTMVPIYMLRQLGFEVSWDAKTETVNISSSSEQGFAQYANKDITLNDLAKMVETANVSIVNLATPTSSSGTPVLTFFYDKDINGEGYPDDLITIMNGAALFDCEYIRIYDRNGLIANMKLSDIKDFLDYKTNAEQFLSTINYSGTQSSSNIQNNSTNFEASGELLLYSNDGKTFLGVLTSNKFDSDSVFNEIGDYGSKFSKTSIWNEYSKYGSEFSQESAFNELATKPPMIIRDGKVIGYLTINPNIENAVSPLGLLQWLEDNGY